MAQAQTWKLASGPSIRASSLFLAPWQRSGTPRRPLPFQEDRIAKLVSPVAVIIESGADPLQHRVAGERAQ